MGLRRMRDGELAVVSLPFIERTGDGSTATPYNASESDIPRRELVDMGSRLLFAVCLVYACSVLAQDAPKVHLRSFNDSEKAVDFYADGRFGCSVRANPEGNNAYCDAEIGIGKHTISAKGPKLSSQSCDLSVGESTHAEANLSKSERLYCHTVFGKVD
jgi:hypothetical protein